MKTDVVIVGGSVAGSMSALYLAQQGIKSIIIEKAQFPRFKIGESLTGESGRMLRQLGFAALGSLNGISES
jgi:FADH2 O2-dependent halogenase